MRFWIFAASLLAGALAASALDAPASTLVVLNKSDATAWLVDPVSGARLASVPTGDGPHEADVTAEASQALLVVHLLEKKVLSVLPTGKKVSHMVAVSPDGKTAFVSSIGSGSVVAIDLVTGAILRTLPTGAEPDGLAWTLLQ